MLQINIIMLTYNTISHAEKNDALGKTGRFKRQSIIQGLKGIVL